jgi:D-serine deaminase-like pyridoxal phosphate-dependent protein
VDAIAPVTRLDLFHERIDALRHQPIAATEKGFGTIAAGRSARAGGSHKQVSPASLAAERPPAFGGEFTMPLLVLRDSALANNASAMAQWCASAGVLLAPHGKTTMAPQLFERQLTAGAWGMTAATMSQVQVYRSFGVDRVLIANELTDRAGIAWLAAELTADPDWECYACVDSLAGVRLLDDTLTAAGASRPLSVLVELGFPGGRTGCRSVAESLDVAAAVAEAGALDLAGVSGYEGGIGVDGDPETVGAVAGYCRGLRALGASLAASIPAPIVSAGGSAYFDVVARELTGGDAADGDGPRVVLRSGCYLTHDHGLYAAVGPATRGLGPALVPAIELWAPVLSCPEPGLALACAGRRDVAFDQAMPIPLRLRRQDGTIEPASAMTVKGLADQHAFINVPPDISLAPGDLVCFGISHPCTTFDKWRVIPVVDDDYRVIDAVHTFF